MLILHIGLVRFNSLMCTWLLPCIIALQDGNFRALLAYRFVLINCYFPLRIEFYSLFYVGAKLSFPLCWGKNLYMVFEKKKLGGECLNKRDMKMTVEWKHLHKEEL